MHLCQAVPNSSQNKQISLLPDNRPYLSDVVKRPQGDEVKDIYKPEEYEKWLSDGEKLHLKNRRLKVEHQTKSETQNRVGIKPPEFKPETVSVVKT